MSSNVVERRWTRGVANIEVRADRVGGMSAKTITGRAIVYNAYSRDLGGFIERVEPGFVAQTLSDGADVLARWQHDSDMLLGRTSAGTLTLADGADGLDYSVPLPDTSYARDLAALAARGDVRHSSFAFRLMPEGDMWGLTDQGTPLRTLKRGGGALIDVAPVVSPAYPDASSGLRSLAEQRGLDLDVVTAAAKAHELGTLLRSRAPTVIDLGAGGGSGERDTSLADAMTAGIPTGGAPASDGSGGASEGEPADEHPLNERQCAQKEAIEALVERFGMFDQSGGPNGAHYSAVSPFATDGLACGSCALFEGPRGCDAVGGDIDPGGICKLWVIPADLIGGARSVETEGSGSAHPPISILRRRLELSQRMHGLTPGPAQVATHDPSTTPQAREGATS